MLGPILCDVPAPGISCFIKIKQRSPYDMTPVGTEEPVATQSSLLGGVSLPEEQDTRLKARSGLSEPRLGTRGTVKGVPGRAHAQGGESGVWLETGTVQRCAMPSGDSLFLNPLVLTSW